MSFVTLTTDFGTRDYYVSLLKASIFKAAPLSQIVDISHEIEAHDIMKAAYFINSVYNRFPLGTIHIAAVNSFYSRKFHFVLFEKDGFHFIGPNNGLFSLIFPDLKSSEIRKINHGVDSQNDFYNDISNVVADLVNDVTITEIGSPLEFWDNRINLQAVVTMDQIRATIIHVDHFGNVIINLDQKTFEKVRGGRNFSIYYKSDDPILKLSRKFGDVMIGDVCAFFNATGLLEIAINMGNASNMLSLNENETIQINFY